MGDIKLPEAEQPAYASIERRLFYRKEVKMALTDRPELVDCTADLGTIIGIQNPAGEIVEL